MKSDFVCPVMAGFSIHHTTIFFILLTYVSGQDCKIEVPLGMSVTIVHMLTTQLYANFNYNWFCKVLTPQKYPHTHIAILNEKH